MNIVGRVVINRNYEDLPENVVMLAKRSILKTVGRYPAMNKNEMNKRS
jgi:hypothetical protein